MEDEIEKVKNDIEEDNREADEELDKSDTNKNDVKEDIRESSESAEDLKKIIEQLRAENKRLTKERDEANDKILSKTVDSEEDSGMKDLFE